MSTGRQMNKKRAVLINIYTKPPWRSSSYFKSAPVVENISELTNSLSLYLLGTELNLKVVDSVKIMYKYVIEF